MSAVVKTVIPYPGQPKFSHRAYCAACRWYGEMHRNPKKATGDANAHNAAVEHKRENVRPEGSSDE